MSYFEKMEGRKFNELVADPEVQKDLVRFFTSSRYNYGREEIQELGPEGLMDKFIDHMRWQDTNEATVARDFYFVQQEQDKDEVALDAFGRLTQAWDRSEGAGTGVLDGAWDYTTAFMASPSTVATFATAGLGGPISKFVGAGAKKAGAIGVRKLLMDRFTKEAGKKVILNTAGRQGIKESTKASLIKGGLAGAAVEGTVGGGHALGQEEIREDIISGYDKDMGKVLAATAISAGIGGGLGAVSRKLAMNKQAEAVDILANHSVRIRASEVDALKRANAKLKAGQQAAKGTPEESQYKYLRDRTTKLAQLLKARDAGKVQKQFLKPLDEDLVAAGEEASRKIFDGPNDGLVTERLTSGTFKKVAAATLDIADTIGFKLDPNIRVTEQVSAALQSGKIDSAGLEAIRKKYGMSKSDFGLIFLSDMSEAGRTLNIGSQIKKGLTKQEAEASAEAAKKSFDSLMEGFDDFAKQGIMNPSDEALERLHRNLTGGKIIGALRELDSFRIGMMTTQLATTAANVGSSIARIGTDVSDRFFLNILEGRNPFKDTTAIIRGLSSRKQDAHVLRILAELDPESETAKMFHDISRIEAETGTSSLLSKAVRAGNFANNLIDTQFKEAVLYSSLQRQIADSGNEAFKGSLNKFLMSGQGLEELPAEMLQKATREALSFSYQYGYKGAEDSFGKLANATITFNKKAPFVLSGIVGMPFPRYIANQLEYIHRHMPTGLAQGLWQKISGASDFGTGPTANEKIAQGISGTLMMLGAIGARLYADPSTTYRETIDPVTGNVIDMSRTMGPYMGHLLIGDIIARKLRGEPNYIKGVENTAEALEVLTSLNGYGFQGGTLRAIGNYLETGNANEELQKWFGDIVATLTMPAATFRDIQGQFNAQSNPSPYTRELMVSKHRTETGDMDPSFMEGAFAQRALRFLPDYEWDWNQWASSFNGKTDVPLYSGFGGGPVRKVDPILSQIYGVDIRPKKNALQTEMVRLNIKPFEIIGSRTIRNPNIDFAVRDYLDKTLPQAFINFRDHVDPDTGKSLKDFSPEVQREMMVDFLKGSVRLAEDKIEAKFQEQAEKNPRSVMGFIINNYEIQTQPVKKRHPDLKAIIAFGLGEVKTEADYLDEAEDIPERLLRMTKIMSWIKEYEAHREKQFKVVD